MLTGSPAPPDGLLAPRMGLAWPDPRATTPVWLRLARLASLLVHLVRMWIGAIVLAPRLAGERRHALMCRWALRMLDVLAVRVVVRGEVPPADKALLLVSNHISW